MKLRLSDRVSLAVLARAKTEADRHEDLGCSIQGPAARPVRRAHAWLRDRVRADPAFALDNAAKLLRAMEETPRYRALCGSGRVGGRRRLREEVLFPDVASLPPRFLHLREGERGLDVPVRDFSALNDLFVALSEGVEERALSGFARDEAAAAVLEALSEAGLLEPHRGALPVPAHSVLFAGHNTFLFTGARGRVLVDPYFRPASALDLPSYRPVHPASLGRVDAVVITHTHGDHFHLGSLLPLPRDTPIFVPGVDRESLFSTDAAARLRQLGFTRAEALPWWESRQVHDVTVQALPFHGEQPTDGEGLYPSLFNEGNTWRLSSGKLSAAFFADAGRDVRGDMADVCRRVRRKLGGVDLLFCGIRGFKLRPIHYGFTTLDAFLVDVPVSKLLSPQQLMADPSDALRYGRLLGARAVAPCADGGAPWYWREGMGPRYDGYPGRPVSEAHHGDENPDADPYPERLDEAARGKSSPRSLVLRPGEAVSASLRRRRFEGHEWPFGALDRARS